MDIHLMNYDIQLTLRVAWDDSTYLWLAQVNKCINIKKTSDLFNTSKHDLFHDHFSMYDLRWRLWAPQLAAIISLGEDLSRGLPA